MDVSLTVSVNGVLKQSCFSKSSFSMRQELLKGLKFILLLTFIMLLSFTYNIFYSIVE